MIEFLKPLFSNAWSIALIVLFFGGSIFVHELGHFLAARRRGLKIDRFSIGFGPKIFGWTRDGIEYRVSWLPLGGYVALPQLADMRGIEGESSTDVSQLPPISYTDKMIVAVMGAVFNLLFAFGLATVVWLGVGQWTSEEQVSTRIGYIVPEVQVTENGRTRTVTSPAVEAGLQVGDRIISIDDRTLDDWDDLRHALITSGNWSADGRRRSVLEVERNGQIIEITVYPQLVGQDRIRHVGIAPAYEPMVHEILPDSLAARSGFQKGDRITAVNGTPVLHAVTAGELLFANKEQPATVELRRDEGTRTITVPPRTEVKDPVDFGLGIGPDVTITHPGPVKQFIAHVKMTVRTLMSLLNPRTDIGLSDLSGPVGIIRIYYLAAQADIRSVLWLTILVNINLAIFNLLPIPVLDGGHMMFATIAKLRGRALPPNILVTTQSVFMVLLFTMVIYVSFFDFRRSFSDSVRDELEQSTPAAEPAPEPSAP